MSLINVIQNLYGVNLQAFMRNKQISSMNQMLDYWVLQF